MTLLFVLALAVSLTGTADARPSLPESGMGNKRSATLDVAGYDKQHGPHYDFECIATSGGANTRLDCDETLPNNEPDIEVNPTNPLNMIASSNDYGSCCGQYQSSAIFESHSDDGGYTWSNPKEISGSNAGLCTFQISGPAGQCDQNQFSVPTVAPNGTVYVAFENEQNQALWEALGQFDDQYLLVKSTNGGQTWSRPTFIVGLEDGSNDYPRNVNGRQTLTGYQVRVNSSGNIVVSPTNGNLYLVFNDNRNGTHNSASPVTNTDVFLMTSSKGGSSWSGPTQVDSSAGDQWFPWVDVDPTNGSIGILYNAALKEIPGSKTIVSTAPSDPTHSRYFRAGVAGCETCATFHGDYINIYYGSDGKANMTWTDMRDSSEIEGLFFQFIYYAQH